jgi:hypothetical protein
LAIFAVLAGKLPDADVVTLNRVVCCYPDAEALLGAAAARTQQVLAFTYPRDRWYVRSMFALVKLMVATDRQEISGVCSLAGTDGCGIGGCRAGARHAT